MPVDFALPESWLAEADTQRRCAQRYRAEAQRFAERHAEAQAAGTHSSDELQALALTRAHYIAHAARIERELHDAER